MKRAREEQEILNSITVRGGHAHRHCFRVHTDCASGAAGEASTDVCKRACERHRVLASHGNRLEAAKPHPRLECRAVRRGA